MKIILKREVITAIAFTLFIILSLTGIFMFFHLFDGYTELIHELLGLTFVGAIILHLILNKKSLKNYVWKKSFVFAVCIVLILSLILLIINKKESPTDIIIQKILNSPLEISLLILGDDYKLAKEKLNHHKIKIEGAQSLLEVAEMNNTSPSNIAKILITQ